MIAIHSVTKFRPIAVAMVFVSLFLLGISLAIAMVSIPSAVPAASGESFGWFASKVEYRGDVSGCAPGEASIEFALVNDYDRSFVTDTVGSWTAIIRDSSGAPVRSQTLSGETLSSPQCFDPISHSLQVIVDDSTNFYELTTPSINPTSDLTMVGFHFRGYVHLRSKTGDPTPDITGISPNGLVTKTTPSFYTQTNILPTLYGATSLDQIKVYAIRLENSAYTTVTAAATGGVGVREISGMPTLVGDGSYFWVYHQNYNGTNFTSRPASAYNWTFTSLPSTGAIRPLTFLYDTTPAATNTVDSVRTQSASGTSAINVEVRVSVMDVTSGMATSSLYIQNTSGVTIARVDVPLLRQLELLRLSLSVSLNQSTQYRFFNVATDAAGNTSTSSIVNFTTPSVASLVPPSFSPTTASDVRSTQITFNTSMSNTGGSIVTSVGGCWTTDITLFTAATNTPNCMQSTPSPTGYGVFQIFRDTHTALPASTTIFFRSFATNGAGTAYSVPISTTTLGLATATSSAPVPPTLGAIGTASTTANSVRLISRVDATGGSFVSSYGFCWALATSSLPAVPNGSSSCFRSTFSLSSGSTLPFWFLRDFVGLPASSTIFYRAYVGNSFGTSTRTGSFITPPAWLDIEMNDYTATTTYSSASETYTLSFPFSARDLSSYRHGIDTNSDSVIDTLVDRNVPFAVTIEDLSGTVIRSSAGSISVRDRFNLPIVFTLSYVDLPPIGYVVVRPIINQPEGIYNESFGSTTARLNNTRPKIYNLIDPNLAEDIVTSTGGGSGPTIPDPSMQLSFATDVIRSGSATNLVWDTKVAFPMSCEIVGPSTFGTGGTFTFDPSVSGTVGTVTTGPLSSAQVFEMTCLEPVTGSVFTTTGRVEVAGRVQER